MQIRIKATGFKLTEAIKGFAEEKILVPLEKRLGLELPPDHILDVELAKITKHHEEGKIWKCEVNMPIPHVRQTLYAFSVAESLVAAIDEVKDEIEREVTDFKNKRSSKILRMARKIKERSHVTRLAQMPGDVYRWFRQK